MAYYIYSEHLSSGKQDFIKIKDTAEEAVDIIRTCYNIDSKSANKNQFYYFMKKVD